MKKGLLFFVVALFVILLSGLPAFAQQGIARGTEEEQRQKEIEEAVKAALKAREEERRQKEIEEAVKAALREKEIEEGRNVEEAQKQEGAKAPEAGSGVKLGLGFGVGSFSFDNDTEVDSTTMAGIYLNFEFLGNLSRVVRLGLGTTLGYYFTDPDENYSYYYNMDCTDFALYSILEFCWEFNNKSGSFYINAMFGFAATSVGISVSDSHSGRSIDYHTVPGPFYGMALGVVFSGGIFVEMRIKNSAGKLRADGYADDPFGMLSVDFGFGYKWK